MRPVVPLAVLIVLAGCVGAPDGSVPAATQRGAFLDPIADDHDHASFADHALATANMHLLGHTTMDPDGAPYSYIGEMDTYGNLTVVQVLGRGSMPGFVVLDVSDPAAPVPIGRAEMPYSYVVDVKWSPDGKHVFAAAQAGTNRQQSDTPPTQDPFLYAVQANGFTQWDMSDPTTPVAVAGGLMEPGGCHMLSVKELGGELTVFCIARGIVHVFQYADGAAWRQVSAFGPGASSTGVERLVAETVGAGPNAPFAALLGVGPHDITIQEDPIEPGRFIASVSYWDLGLRFYDVTDPLRVVELGAWGGDGAQVYEGNVHGAALYGHHGDRLAVVGPELLGSTHPAMWILDVNDFAAPKVVGEWVPPGEHVSQGLLLTTHQFQVVNERIYLAYNHAGVWVLDIHEIMGGEYAADPNRPDVLGYYLPHEEVELYDAEHAAVPNTWDVNVRDGLIFASDRYTGFYVLHLAEDEMGNAAITSGT